MLGGVPQVIFGGGDGWLYSFDPEGDGKGNSKLLWKFDCNPKTSHYALNKATRNHIIGTPVIYDGRVYVAVGEDPEHGEGTGHLWCIDPTKRGDVSPELAFNSKDPTTPIRAQAAAGRRARKGRLRPAESELGRRLALQRRSTKTATARSTSTKPCTARSAAWRSRTTSCTSPTSAACSTASTPRPASGTGSTTCSPPSWGSPLIVDGKVYIGDEDGDVAIFKHSADPNVAMKKDGGEMKPFYGEINMGNSVYSTPIVADNVLYIANRTHLFAIENGATPVEANPPAPAAKAGAAQELSRPIDG